MIKTEQIIEAIVPAFEKGLILLFIVVIFKVTINLIFKKMKLEKNKKLEKYQK